jgi:predicted negative regulator of RcsB-dependent stress response
MLNDEIKGAVDDFDKFEGFFQENLNSIMFFCVLLACTGIVAAFIYNHIERSEHNAAATLTEADTPETINAALSKYPSSHAVTGARMRLATIMFKKKDFPKALELYKNVALNASVGELKNRAAMNVAYTLEAMGKLDDAAEKFSSLSNIPSMSVNFKNEAGYSAARLFLQLGKNERAKNSLKSVAFDKPGFWAAQGKQLSRRLN